MLRASSEVSGKVVITLYILRIQRSQEEKKAKNYFLKTMKTNPFKIIWKT